MDSQLIPWEWLESAEYTLRLIKTKGQECWEAVKEADGFEANH